MAWSLPSINPIGKIMGIKKDRRSRNMAIEPEQFEKKFNKFKNLKHSTGAKFGELANELDDVQIDTINKAFEAKREANKTLRPFGLHDNDPQASFLYWGTKDVEDDRKEGKIKEKNPRR